MSFNSFKPNPKRTTILPLNYKKGKSVKEYVEYYANSHKLRVEQALQVQGADCIIWNRVYNNRFCTCQNLESIINNNPAVVNNIRPEIIEEKKIKQISNLSSKQVENTKVRKVLSESGLSDLASIIESQYETGFSEQLEEIKTERQFKRQNSIIEEALQLQQENLGVENSDLVSCPICFGTRRTECYQPYKGVRLVLDASEYYPLKLKGCRVNKNSLPNILEFDDSNNSFAEWEIELPSYFRTESIRVFNLDHISTSFSLSFKEVTESSYNILDINTLNARNGLKNILRIRATVNRDNITDNLKDVKLALSHLELVLMFTEEYEKIELPSLDIPENVDFAELYLRSRAVMSPFVENVGKNSLFCEKKHGLLWEISSMNKNFTVEGNLVGLRADTRLIQNSEKLHLLNLFTPTLTSTGSNYSR